VLIGNLPTDVQEEELLAIFSTVGEVSKILIPKDKAGKAIGFAFISMAQQKKKAEAVAALDRSEFRGRLLSVSLKKG
jgi:RNA recognition motif-containing protein